jgi:hypothetical protein
MAGPELAELLESAAPAPTTTLDIGSIERRANRRRRRRHGAFATGSLLVGALALGLTGLLSTSPERQTVIAGPPSSGTIPIRVGAGTATLDIALLDGTRLNVTLPKAMGDAFAGVTFGDLELHGSVYAGLGSQRGWRVDVTVGSIDRLVVGGEPVSVPPSTTASAATVDRLGHRLGLQFGSWAVVVSGDTLTSGDIDALLAGIALAETPDGFVQYAGSLPLWIVDSPDALLSTNTVALSTFMRECSARAARPTETGLIVERVNSPDAGVLTMLCDPTRRIEMWLRTAEPPSDEEVDRIKLDVLSVGPTLAAVQRGQRP